MRKVIFFLSSIFLFSCSMAPKYERPKIDLPESRQEKKEQIDKRWWEKYKDEKLNALIEEALKNNDDLLLAYERIKEASYYYTLATAELFPELDLSVTASRQKISKRAKPFGGITYSDFSISSILSYELDFFGRLKDYQKAELHRLLAQKAYADTVRLKLVADVTTLYLDLCTVQEQINIMEDLLKRYEEIYSYRKRQYENGLIDILPVEQEKTLLDGAKLNLKKLNEKKDLIKNSLSLLLGRQPKGIFSSEDLTCKGLPEAIPIPSFIPSDVLEQRPDIFTAEQNLIASHYDVGAVKAEYFPRIFLTGAAGLRSASLSNLFTSSANMWSLGASLLSPLLDFGRTKSEVEIAQSLRRQALIEYIKSVKNAFSEVNQALINLEALKEQIELQKIQVDNYSSILKVAQKRYENGLVDYMNVLQAERDYETSLLDLITLKGDYLKGQVVLYKALGGGWERE
ncbi:TolC family protein [Hydrogenobacter thermophilus]|uniref:TolC family protein n=1 Tax=Hydrogenobacter thermophilus TaxID=940 RepID=UPI0030F9F07A